MRILHSSLRVSFREKEFSSFFELAFSSVVDASSRAHERACDCGHSVERALAASRSHSGGASVDLASLETASRSRDREVQEGPNSRSTSSLGAEEEEEEEEKGLSFPFPS